MQSESESGPDWRDSAAYVPLLDAERSLFAWEWLRRDPAYRSAAERAVSGESRITRATVCAADFGLVAFEPPGAAVPQARPMWTAEVLPGVLRAEAARPAAGPADTVDLQSLKGFGRLIAGCAVDHLLLSDGLRTIRIDGPKDTFTGGPASLRYAIEGLAAAEAPLLTLRRFLALCRTGGFARSLHPREARARRWILLLRARDALAAGADQRQIAALLFSRSAGDPCWRTREPSVRSQVQRLVRSARLLAASGGYRTLLSGRTSSP